MAINLLGLVKDQLSSAVIGNAAKMIGGSNAATSKALDGIMPTLLGGLMKKSSTQSGAGELFNMLKDGGHDGGILNNMSDLFSGGEATRRATTAGDGILSSIFGNGLGSIVGKIASVAGLQRSGASSLMSMAAPILMGLVGKQVKSQGLNASGLASLLGGQTDFLKAALPSGMGDVLGLGSMLGGAKAAAGNVANAAANVGGKATAAAANVGGRATAAASNVGGKATAAVAGTAAKGGSFLRWLLPLVLIGAVALFALRYMGCGAADNALDSVKNTTSGVVDGAKGAVKGGADLAKDGVKAVGGAVAGFGSKVVDGVKSFTLPGGGKVSFREGTFGDKFTSFLGVSSNKAGKRFTFDNLTFATGSANLDGTSLKEVAELSKVLKAFPKVHINMEGHTDSRGNADKNKALSLARATAVKNQLASTGISTNRLTVEGLGSDKPANASNPAAAENRRVEVVVTKL